MDTTIDSSIKKTNSRIGAKILATWCIALVCVFVPTATHAAKLYLTPSATSIEKGSTFTVAVKVDTEGQNINVVEAAMSFPADAVSIVKVTPSATFSIQTPGSPKVTKSQVSFSSGIPSPGYTGQSGAVGTITFRALKAGPVALKIDSGKVLLNDGNATSAQVQRVNSTVQITGETTTLPAEPILPTIQDNSLIVEQPEVVPTQPVATEVIVPESRQPDDVVTTITIRVKDLIRIVYVLAVLLGIFVIIALFLLVSNINLKHKNKMMREMSKI